MPTALTVAKPADPIHRGYRFDVEPVSGAIRVEVGGVTVAESERAVVMLETRLPPVFYFPRDDVRMELFHRTTLRTHCPFKGNASYWTLTVGDRTVENAAWSYEDPFEEAMSVKGYVAFHWDKMDAWHRNGRPMDRPQAQGTAKDNPFVDWLVRKAPHAGRRKSWVQGFAGMLVDAGLPVWRLRLLIRTLHPQVLASVYTWNEGADELEVHHPTYQVLQNPDYRNSPFAHILRGEGGIRRRLNGPHPKLDFPVLEELHEQGCDRLCRHAAQILRRPAEHPHAGVARTRRLHHRVSGPDLRDPADAGPPRGSACHAPHRRDPARHLSRPQHRPARAGRADQARRGRGHPRGDLVLGSPGLDHAVGDPAALDLSRFARRLLRRHGRAVMDHGGEVLKFIGDAVLAIFPIEDPESERPTASVDAIAAVREARRRLDEHNRERQARGEPLLQYGITLHRGDLTYGNIGASGRLDFTVIGPAVNEASRIQDLCREIGSSVLLSAAFAGSFTGKLRSVGPQRLRGVEAEQELFVLPENAGGRQAVRIHRTGLRRTGRKGRRGHRGVA